MIYKSIISNYSKTVIFLLNVIVVYTNCKWRYAHAQGCDPQEVTKLLPVDGEAGDVFGTSVSINGNVAAISAGWDCDIGTYAGSIYI